MNRITKPEVCDATGDDSTSKAGFIVFKTLFLMNFSHLKVYYDLSSHFGGQGPCFISVPVLRHHLASMFLHHLR